MIESSWQLCIKHTSKTCNKRFWHYIKNQCKEQFEQIGIPALLVNGNVINEDCHKIESLNDYFNLYILENNIIYSYPNTRHWITKYQPNCSISVEGIKALLADQGSNKAWGPDNISTRFLKETAWSSLSLVSPLSSFNRSRKSSKQVETSSL